MNIYVEHDATTLSALGLTTNPGCDGLMLRHGQPDDVLAARYAGNPLAGEWMADLSAPGPRGVCWSGTLAGDLFEAHPMTWLRPGHEALHRLCEKVGETLANLGQTLCFHPHRRHVLNDPPSCLRFLREHEGQPFEVALAPGDLFEASMVEDAEDHLTRCFETLGGTCAMLILRDVLPHAADSEAGPGAAPLGEGILPRKHVRSLIADLLPTETPVVITGCSMEQQLDWLLG